ncbi:PrgI family protein [Phytoactinopolyspora alkaliphila]|uniref:PrgI family protein n=1 Tax=Phytoactinopolyspora alkaliphila TaxID=1783498 RepID=A0A6N9YPH9_9ACTN|nr:SCO6880 family protein [Phytoactinopolyspora alkaliphila]NED96840.1 PrgI family protein [Phytoactinopolyspora alkaliphila]
MWGLSGGQLLAIGVAASVFGPSAMTAGTRGLVATAPVWGTALLFAFLRPHGRTLVAWTPIVANWILRRTRGQNAALRRPDRPRPAGTLALPGEVGALRLYRHGPTTTAMIHDPHRRTLTAVMRLRYPAFLLLGQDDRNRRVQGWGQALSGACRTGRISRVQVLERTTADGGEAVHAYWRDAGNSDTGSASASYEDLITTAGPASARHETLLALTMSIKHSARAIRTAGGGLAGAATVLIKELSAVTANLRSAEIGVDSWLDEAELALLINTAFNPGRGPVWDRTGHGRGLAVAGPMAVTAAWDHLRCDETWHAVFWVREWPREDVDATFLSPLMLTNSVQRSVSVIYRPRTTREAMKDVRVEQTEQESEQRRRDKHDIRTTAAQQRERDDVDRRERELVAGHADLAFTGLISVSAGTKEDLDAAIEETEGACHQSGLDTVLLYGQQDAAFYAAALPLGRVLI